MHIPTELHFLINWLDDSDPALYDTVPSKLVDPPKGTQILDVRPGMICRVSHDGQFYDAKVVAYGMILYVNVSLSTCTTVMSAWN